MTAIRVKARTSVCRLYVISKAIWRVQNSNRNAVEAAEPEDEEV